MLAEPIIDFRRVKIECPSCGKEQYVKLCTERLEPTNGVVSLVIKAACDHEFHLYVDKQFQVRGYERIDAVVSAEMLQVDQEISDFMKGEGIKERASGRFVGKLRNDVERERYLETVIRYYRGADVADSYWVAEIGGRRPEPATFDPAKNFPLPPLPSSPAPPVVNHGAQVPPVAPTPAGKATARKEKAGLEGLPPPKASVISQATPGLVTATPEDPKIETQTTRATEPGVEHVPETPVADPGIAVKPEAEAVAASAPTEAPEAPEAPEITLDDLRSQFEARIKKINDIMIKLELDNLNEAVSDVELVKKKAKLAKIKDDLEVQFNKIVSERGLDKGSEEKPAASLA
ncbi:MAG: hypothetical protein JW839_22500 [Candidatus Lokiarchaeota archaeon]|nr:hypothetical protein [Candidatus Lokiarchaeota archaeon]